jgi:hypothetical protein
MRKNHSTLVNGPGELYAAKLLFQWRVIASRKQYKRRVCEERVILMRARNPREALKKAKRYGASECFNDHRKDRKVFFEFIGVVDLDDMKTEFNESPAEVWYELREMLQPMERKQRLLVPERHMRAFEIPKRGRGSVRIYG